MRSRKNKTSVIPTKHRKRILSATLISYIALMSSGALAQNDELQIEIEAQDTNMALLELAEESGVQIIFTPELVDNLKSGIVSGRMTVEDAVARLLDGTNLSFERLSDRTIVIKQAEAVESGAVPDAGTNELARRASNDPADSPERNKAPTDNIVVTGTRLKGVDPSAPIYRIDKAEIDRRGLNTIEEIVRYLPQNFSTLNSGAAFTGSASRDNIGTTTINLRGLGEGATLVLVNGKRVAASPAVFGTFTDVSTIPFSAIERVEVLSDGGSAIYGSDAVGGVINFILKKDYRGAETSVRYENSSSGGDRYLVEQTAGVGWRTGNITASFSYLREDPVSANKAGIDTDFDLRDRGGRAFAQTLGQPGIIRASGSFPGNPPPGALFAFLPEGNDGTIIDPNDFIFVTSEEFSNQTGNFNLMPLGSGIGIGLATPKTRNYTGYLALTQELGRQLTLDVSGTYANRRSKTETGANFLFATVPASNFYNTFGAPIFVGYTFDHEVTNGLIDPQIRQTDTERYSVYGSLTWNVPLGDWEAIASYGLSKDIVDNNSFAVFSSSNPTDAFVEALSSPDPDTAINLFGDGTAQRSNLNELVSDDEFGSRSSKQNIASVSLSGSLIDLPGGTSKLVVGGELRTDELDFNDFRFRPTGADEFVPKSDNSAVYAELFIPIFGEQNAIPGIERLSLQFAGRYDRYKIEGQFNGADGPESSRTYGDFVPKVGVSWFPVQDLKIRATWGKSFQAPTLPELFSPTRTVFRSINDPRNPDSNGGPSAVLRPEQLTGGNPDLEEQKAETISVGFDFTPDAVPGLYLSATWNRIKFTDLIARLRDVYGFDLAVPLENSELFPDIFERDENGILIFLKTNPVNLTGRLSTAVDFEARYSFETSIGDFTAGVLGTRMLTLETTTLPGLDPVQLLATDAGPSKWNLNAYVDWARGNWTGSVTLNHESGYMNADPDARRTDVDGYTTVDLQAGYTLPDAGWRFNVGVRNLLKPDFPFYDGVKGVDGARVDFRQRVIFVNVIKDFSF